MAHSAKGTTNPDCREGCASPLRSTTHTLAGCRGGRPSPVLAKSDGATNPLWPRTRPPTAPAASSAARRENTHSPTGGRRRATAWRRRSLFWAWDGDEGGMLSWRLQSRADTEAATASRLLRPLRRLAIPAVRAELLDELRVEAAFVAGGDIRFDVLRFPHSGNNGAHVRVRENETQSHFGHGD